MTIDSLRRYIQTEILNDPEYEIGDDEDLLISEILDSISVVRLMTYLEETMGIKIPAEDVTTENVGTLRSLQDYVTSRT